jgi:hypothetical protein
MSELFKKLNLKDQSEIVVANAPDTFDKELAKLGSVKVIRDTGKAKTVDFAVAFATTQSELDNLSKSLTTKARNDAILWIAYPKKSSRKYKCEFNRDSGWAVLRAAGFETVRMVAIDDDWSALRFRRTEYIRSMTRSSAK